MAISRAFFSLKVGQFKSVRVLPDLQRCYSSCSHVCWFDSFAPVQFELIFLLLKNSLILPFEVRLDCGVARCVVTAIAN